MIPTLDQIQHVAVVAGDVLGAVFALCTIVGNPLAKFSNGKLSAFGHLVLAFGADVSKAQKRIAELFSRSEPL